MKRKHKTKTIYPPNWNELVAAVRMRSDGRCECTGECGLHKGRRCVEQHGSYAQFARGRVMLTTAHLDHKSNTADISKLKAMCQRCHLRYDREQHAQSAYETRTGSHGQPKLPFQ